MDKAILLPIIVWAILTVVAVLKKTLSPAARTGAALVFVVFGFIFKDDLVTVYHMKDIPYMVYLRSSFEYVFISLAVVWPATLYFTQHMTEADASAVIVKLAIFSALIGAGFLFFM